MNRGVEIASDVADSARSHILDQVEHGVAVRMGVLTALCGSAPEPVKRTPRRELEEAAMRAQGKLL